MHTYLSTGFPTCLHAYVHTNTYSCISGSYVYYMCALQERHVPVEGKRAMHAKGVCISVLWRSETCISHRPRLYAPPDKTKKTETQKPRMSIFIEAVPKPKS